MYHLLHQHIFSASTKGWILMHRRIAAALTFATTLQLGSGVFAQQGLQLSAAPPATESRAAMEQETASARAKAAFDKLVDDYFQASFLSSPDSATEAGIHDYDNLLSDWSKETIAKRETELQHFRNQFQAIDPAQLDQTSCIDRLMLIAQCNSELLSLQSIQSWKKNPDTYGSDINSSIFSLIKRNFASPEQRMKSVIAREKAVPKVLQEARENLENTPKIYTEIALEQMPGMIEFFEKDVPGAFAEVKNPELLAQFKAANDETIKQFKEYQTFLKKVILPKSVANFAIGKENYQKKLLYNEMVDTPLDQLLANGYTELHRLQKEFIETAHRIDPNKTPADVYASISSEHPKPDQLLSSVQNVLSGLHDQCLAVVDIPSEDQLKVQETPPFERATTFASMDAPGPFETKAKEAYYNVTLPESGWDAKRTEEHMRFFCTLDLINTSEHEAYPGHYVQGLWLKQAPSKTRKLLGCGTNIEGWAHYCEQMMADLQPDNLKLKMVQLHDALLRVSRYIVGIKMHTDGMTLEQGKQFFITEGYQEPANADREAKRGTSDPTYLIYTLGKMQILALRDEYKKQQGDKYSLKQFHDEFLAQGMAPVKLIGQVMLSK
jgi:uncharacterized protein (DUF885 family)